MNQMISKLKTILNAEVDCYRQMDRLLDQEKTVLSRSLHGDFENIQLKKETLVAALQRLESDRMKLVRRLADQLDMGGEGLRVNDLVSHLSQPESEELASCCDQLKHLLDKVRDKNRRNRHSINHYLELVNGSMRLLSGLIEDASVYHKPGSSAPVSGYTSSGGRLLCQNI